MITLTIDGIAYQYPEDDDEDWGAAATLAVKSLSDVINGFRSPSSPQAASGNIRFGNGDSFAWRNNANNGDILLYIDGADDLIYDDGVTTINLTANAAGNVTGPGSSTDNAMVRFDGVTGQVIQDSGVIVDDSDNVSGIVDLLMTGNLTVNGNLQVDGISVLGSADTDTLDVNATIISHLIATAATYDLGSSTKPWRAAYLDNGATDGGAIYFDAGTTKFLKALAAGTKLELGGFSGFHPAVSVGADLGETTNRWGALRLGTDIGNSGTPDAKTLYADLIPKAWAWSPSTGLSGRTNVNLPNTGAPGGDYSHSSTGVYDYYFQTQLTSAKFAVSATPESSNNHATVSSQGADGFTVIIKNTISGNLVDDNHSVIVMGRQ